MVGGSEETRTEALDRMREAAVLLDHAGLMIAGCHLQMAIDVVEGTVVPGCALMPDRPTKA